MSHVKATAASIGGALVTLTAAFAPSWSSEHQALIVSTGGAISLLIPVVNALHQLIDQLLSKQVSPQTLEAEAVAVLAGQLGKVDFNALAAKAVASQNLGALVRVELQQLLRGVTPAAPVIPPAPAPVTPAA